MYIKVFTESFASGLLSVVPLREILLVLTDSFLPKVGSKVSVDPVTLISTNGLNFFLRGCALDDISYTLSGTFWRVMLKKNLGKSVLFLPELTYAFIALGKDFGRDGKEVFFSSGASMYRALF